MTVEKAKLLLNKECDQITDIEIAELINLSTQIVDGILDILFLKKDEIIT